MGSCTDTWNASGHVTPVLLVAFGAATARPVLRRLTRDGAYCLPAQPAPTASATLTAVRSGAVFVMGSRRTRPGRRQFHGVRRRRADVRWARPADALRISSA
ncbi:hypothetical protein OG713_42710 [Streptomyces sp. NBC_00723]|uniref:hypothetical protein n=1 Tax=Streptomyces sp. NBC_00723 TaxID=2903673 RepID=UPI00386E8EF9